MKNKLSLSLRNRHIAMISIGGCIGAGLFVGSGTVINQAGPAAIFSFIISGLVVFSITYILGEMTIHFSKVDSFYEHANKIWNKSSLKAISFFIGWSYCYFWGVCIALEVIAGAKLIQFWFPQQQLWIFGIFIIVSMTAINLASVRFYGECEFWLALIKVIAILIFITLAILYLSHLLPSSKNQSYVIHYNSLIDFFPKGVTSVFSNAVVVMGFYFGAEIVSITSAETNSGQKYLRKLINRSIFRILLFYIGSVSLIVFIIPWNSSEIFQPFVSSFHKFGIPYGKDIMNLVLITAVLSAISSGIYAISMMLLRLSANKEAPQLFKRVSYRGVPKNAILFSTTISYLAVIVSYFSPNFIFKFLLQSYGLAAMFVYLMIAISNLKLLRTTQDKINHYLITSFAIISLSIMFISMFFSYENRIALFTFVLVLMFMLISYIFKYNQERQTINEI